MKQTLQKIKELAEDFHFEIILWRDSYAPPEHDSWHIIKPQLADKYIAISMGLVIEEDEHHVRVLQNYGHGEGMNEIVIPKDAILDDGRIAFDAQLLSEIVQHIDRNRTKSCRKSYKVGNE